MNEREITEKEILSLRRSALKRKLDELLWHSLRREELRMQAIADTLAQGTSSAERESAVKWLESHARLSRDVSAALARIDGNTYGICEDCKQPIEANRLDAAPWAPLKPEV